MARQRDPFKRRHFPKDVILMAVRWYRRFALSYRDVLDFLEERSVSVYEKMIYCRFRRLEPEIAKRSFKYKSCRSLDWHVPSRDIYDAMHCRSKDEIYARVEGKRRYLWCTVDHSGQLIDFRLTARRDTKAARAFFKQACDNARLYQPMVTFTDRAQSDAKIIDEINRWSFPGAEIKHIDRKWRNNRIGGDHAALKKMITPTWGFKSLSAAKDTLVGIETVRSIKNGHVVRKGPGVAGQIRFIVSLFPAAV